MGEEKTENARIKSTSFGIERGAFLTFYLYLEYDGGGQGAGGWLLANTSIGSKTSGVSCMVIADLLAVVGVDKWEELPGKHIRVKHTWSKVFSIGHIIKDKWFHFEDIKDYAIDADEELTTPGGDDE